MIKPDGVQRALVGEIIKRFELKGYYLRGLKLLNVPKELAEEHYVDLKSKPFYTGLVEYIIRCCLASGVAWLTPLHPGNTAAMQERPLCNLPSALRLCVPVPGCVHPRHQACTVS